MRRWPLGSLRAIAMAAARAPGMQTLVIALLFGAIGGFGQALLAQGGVLRLPALRETRVDFGFLSDLVIGAVGGLGSLVLGSVLLRALNPQLLQAGGEGVAALVSQLPPWVLLASFAVLTGFSSRRFLPAVSDRLTAAIAERVQEETQKAKTEIAEVTSDQVSATLDQVSALAGGAPGPVPTPDGGAADGLEAMRRLVEEYDAIADPEWRERVRKKDVCYAAMSRTILASSLGADALVAEFASDGKQGWILALAALASARPELGMGTTLIDHAKKVDWKHVMYRVASAIGILATRRVLTQREAARAWDLFEEFPRPDESLRSKFAATRSLLDARFGSLPA